MSIRAILFDLDGTLVDSERESAEAIARALRTGLGIEITQDERDFIIGRSWVEIYANLQRGHAGLSWSRDKLIAETARERENVFAEDGLTILPGAIEAVRRFDHMPRALVTGSSRVEARQALEATGLTAAFDAVFVSEDVSSSKPHPEGYLAAAAALELPPGACVVIEDSHAGIRAGIDAGARVIGVRAGNFHGQDQSAAHRIIDTLDELTEQLLVELGGL
jgi:HAD superfamily hydrolase (TIGR01509 family)